MQKKSNILIQEQVEKNKKNWKPLHPASFPGFNFFHLSYLFENLEQSWYLLSLFLHLSFT